MTPKIFISYSWTTPEHEDWVMNLAERLVSDGVEVVIDKWNLKEGQDKYNFMENMVKSPEINKVLIILDKTYSNKANNRSGGVGTETQIISPKIYKDVEQEKFIPIIAEKDEKGIPFIPVFLDGRIYIDLSESSNFEAAYINLLRNIYNRPQFSKPKLGKAPRFLFEDTPMKFKTTQIVRSFETIIDKHPNRINSVIRDFFDTFLDNLKDFDISTQKATNNKQVGKLICDNINEYTLLRDDYIGFIHLILKGEYEFDVDNFMKFFEKLALFQFPQNGLMSWQDWQFENFRFIIHELFLYTIAVGLKNENYNFVAEILYSPYFIENRYNSFDTSDKNFSSFYFAIESINSYHNELYTQKFINAQADFLIKRVHEEIGKDLLVHADVLCYYIGVLQGISWFPQTYIYSKKHFDLFVRLVSARHFEKIKVIFDVNTIAELKSKLEKIKENSVENRMNRIGYSSAMDSVKPIYSIIDINTIGTKK